MKKIFTIALAVAAFAACNKENTIEVAQNPAIAFDNMFVDNATKATDITKDNISDFGVYASIQNTEGATGLILTNEEVKGSASSWTYTNIQYWAPKAKYDFTAFAPYTNAKWSYAPTATAAQNGTVTFDNESAKGDQDFIFAYETRDLSGVEAIAEQPAKVGFTFDHQLAKITFKFNNGFLATNNITLKVYNVKVAGVVSKASASVANGTAGEWGTAEGTFERTFGAQSADEAAVIAAQTALTTDHHYFIPVAGTQYTITFDVDIIQAGVKVDTYHHSINATPSLAKGGNYYLTTKLDPSNVSDDPTKQLYPIEFNVSAVEAWDPANGNVDVM